MIIPGLLQTSPWRWDREIDRLLARLLIPPPIRQHDRATSGATARPERQGPRVRRRGDAGRGGQVQKRRGPTASGSF